MKNCNEIPHVSESPTSPLQCNAIARTNVSRAKLNERNCNDGHSTGQKKANRAGARTTPDGNSSLRGKNSKGKREWSKQQIAANSSSFLSHRAGARTTLGANTNSRGKNTRRKTEWNERQFEVNSSPFLSRRGEAEQHRKPTATREARTRRAKQNGTKTS